MTLGLTTKSMALKVIALAAAVTVLWATSVVANAAPAQLGIRERRNPYAM